MEILCISHAYPPAVGGKERQSYELVRGLSRRITVHTLIHGSLTGKWLFFLSLKKKVRRILAEHPGISLIHLNDGLMAMFALPLREMTDIPIIVTIHGPELLFPIGWFRDRVVPRFREFDGVIAVSHAVEKLCIERGFDPARITVVPNGVDTALGSVAPVEGYRSIIGRRLGIDLSHKKLLVMLGRPVPRKGFLWFLREVLPALASDVVCLHVGPSSPLLGFSNFLLRILPSAISRRIQLLLGLPIDEPALRREIARPEMTGRAYRLGGLPFKDLVQTLLCADLLVMPNLPVEHDMEGFALPVLEAGICGLPVAAAALDGIPDVVQEERNGILLSPGDAAAWARRLNDLLADPERLVAMGRNGKEFTSAHCSWERTVDDYEKIFRKFT